MGKVFTYNFQSDPCSCQNLTCVNHRFNAIACFVRRHSSGLDCLSRKTVTPRILSSHGPCCEELVACPWTVYVLSRSFAGPFAKFAWRVCLPLSIYTSPWMYYPSCDDFTVSDRPRSTATSSRAPLRLWQTTDPDFPNLTNGLYPCPRLSVTLSMVPATWTSVAILHHQELQPRHRSIAIQSQSNSRVSALSCRK